MEKQLLLAGVKRNCNVVSGLEKEEKDTTATF